MEKQSKQRQDLILFFIAVAVISLSIGFYEGLLGNYFKDAYHINAFDRGMIELPRELPGILCFILVSLLAFLGDITLAIIAQGLAAIGLFVLGFFTPLYGVMLVFLFINSMGLHLYMPIRDSIGMALAEPDKIGKRMGQYAGVRFAFMMVAGVAAFFLFRFEVFSFAHETKWAFVAAAVFATVAMLILVKLKRDVGQVRRPRGKFRLLFRKEYKFYYILAIVFGMQKQVMLVFGPWVLISMLDQPVDIIVLLGVISSLIGVFFMPRLGKWIDHFGVKKLLFVDAITFIVIYLAYGVLCHLINDSVIAAAGATVIIVSSLFVLDRLSTQMGMIRTVYLKSIAKKESDIMPTLSLGLALDHVVSIAMGISGGVIWMTLGAQYIFYIVAALSLVNLFVAIAVKLPGSLAQQKDA